MAAAAPRSSPPSEGPRPAGRSRRCHGETGFHPGLCDHPGHFSAVIEQEQAPGPVKRTRLPEHGHLHGVVIFSSLAAVSPSSVGIAHQSEGRRIPARSLSPVPRSRSRGTSGAGSPPAWPTLRVSGNHPVRRRDLSPAPAPLRTGVPFRRARSPSLGRTRRAAPPVHRALGPPGLARPGGRRRASAG